MHKFILGYVRHINKLEGQSEKDVAWFLVLVNLNTEDSIVVTNVLLDRYFSSNQTVVLETVPSEAKKSKAGEVTPFTLKPGAAVLIELTADDAGVDKKPIMPIILVIVGVSSCAILLVGIAIYCSWRRKRAAASLYKMQVNALEMEEAEANEWMSE